MDCSADRRGFESTVGHAGPAPRLMSPDEARPRRALRLQRVRPTPPPPHHPASFEVKSTAY